MKELKTNDDYNWDAWFWVDKEEFKGEWQIGRCRYRVEKAVGRGDDGKLFLMIWTNHDQCDWHKFSQVFYEIGPDEYIALLDRAVEQGEVRPDARDGLIKKMEAPFTPPWDIHKEVVVYRDERYTLGQRDDRPYLIANGEKYILSCHPYEPCLYITDKGGNMTAVHNAFDPFDVLECFSGGETITSITGTEYDAKDFCRMVEYAADMVDVQIDEAEKVFQNSKKKQKEPPKTEDKKFEKPDGEKDTSYVIKDEIFGAVIADYPDCVIDYCLVENENRYAPGYNSHRLALVRACRSLLAGDEETDGYGYDVGKADAALISAEKLFAPANENGKLNYRKAFLYPPYETGYTDSDFDRVNAALFPNGTDGLEIYEWTTDWSDYFDEGHEWWGALCITAYDKAIDRFAVIMASATD